MTDEERRAFHTCPYCHARLTRRQQAEEQVLRQFAARLDAALAGDPREAVERAWALVRELREE